MNIKTKYNNQIYDAIYDEQSGYYEINLKATEVGGIENIEITATDILNATETDNIKVQILAKEKNTNISEESIVYFLDKDTLEIKDILEFQEYEYKIDSETNCNTIFEISRKIDCENGDIVILKRNNNIDYIGIIEIVTSENDANSEKITLKYINNIFDKDILVEEENILSEKGVEDFIAKMIYKNFTNSEDNFLNIKWLDVEVKTHTKKAFSIENNNLIYNFHTFTTNCFQNYNIVQDFSYENGRIKLTIYKQDEDIVLIDCTSDDVSNYEEQYKTSVTAKVTVETDTDIQKWYLLNDRTTTQNMNDQNRAKGKEVLVYTSKSEDAEQTAMNQFKSNSYEHMITFKVNKKSEIIDVSKLKVGTPISIKTKNNLIFDSYISAITDDGGNFIEFTSGNIRIKYIDKILQERNKNK